MEQAPTKQLFVRPIRSDVREEDLIEHFSAAAPVVEVRLMEGYAFLTFDNESDAGEALSKFAGTDFRDEQLQVEFAKERKEDTRGKYRLKITGLPEGTAWQDVKDFVRDKTGTEANFVRVFRDYDSGDTICSLQFETGEDLEKSIPCWTKQTLVRLLLVLKKILLHMSHHQEEVGSEVVEVDLEVEEVVLTEVDMTVDSVVDSEVEEVDMETVVDSEVAEVDMVIEVDSEAVEVVMETEMDLEEEEVDMETEMDSEVVEVVTTVVDMMTDKDHTTEKDHQTDSKLATSLLYRLF